MNDFILTMVIMHFNQKQARASAAPAEINHSHIAINKTQIVSIKTSRMTR